VKVLALAPVQPDTNNLLEVLDIMRERVLKGDIVALTAAAIGPDDSTYAYAASSVRKTRLQMMGAIAHLQHCYHNGDVADGKESSAS